MSLVYADLATTADPSKMIDIAVRSGRDGNGGTLIGSILGGGIRCRLATGAGVVLGA